MHLGTMDPYAIRENEITLLTVHLEVLFEADVRRPVRRFNDPEVTESRSFTGSWSRRSLEMPHTMALWLLLLPAFRRLSHLQRVFLELAYKPRATPTMELARQHGWQTVDGLEVLLVTSSSWGYCLWDCGTTCRRLHSKVSGRSQWW